MELQKRKKIRLEGFDYSSNGAYFVTICTYNRERILGDIDINVGQGLCSCRLSHIGRIVQDEIQNITNRYVGVKIDKYVIMPNHIHLIVLLERQEQSPCPTICFVRAARAEPLPYKPYNWGYRLRDKINFYSRLSRAFLALCPVHFGVYLIYFF